MANHAQAEKRARQNTKRRSTNRLHRVSMRTAIKKVRAAIAAGDKTEAIRLLPVAVSKINRVSSRGAIHRNTAARTVSRLSRAVATVE
ncbi:MAG: 30S ribosomal protein S20 [bacterium]